MSPDRTPAPVRPIWPTSVKVLVALVAGMVFMAVTMVQFVPRDVREELEASGTATGDEAVGFRVNPDAPGRDGEDATADDTDTADGGTGPTSVGGDTSTGGSGASDGASGQSADGGVGIDLTAGGGGRDSTSDDPTGGGTLTCAAGNNGGQTDTGVSADKIRLASNVVLDGPGANFLSQAPDGMEAVIRRVNNEEGGICGRTLDLFTVNDGWDAVRGRNNIVNFIEEGYFALPVVPSSEGLSLAIETGVIDDAGIPVVGTEGLRKEQYDAGGNAKWVWPVATATVSQVRVMAKYAQDQGAKSFGIVFDRRYRFGVEGADAFETYIEGQSGLTLEAKLGIEPGQPNYVDESNSFKGECDPCDVVVLLLEPETGRTWMSSAGEEGKGTIMTAGSQSLFNTNFADNCGKVCNGVLVWTGYNPAIGSNLNDDDIARYAADLRSVNPSADITNQFTMSAYLGMEVFVEALKACSPNLKRTCVREKMDAFDYPTGMASTLKWRPGEHFANLGARAYAITYDGSNFSGFRDTQSGFVRDPTPGVVE